MTEDLARRDRSAGEVPDLIEQIPDDLDAFLGLKRAAAIEQDAARFGTRARRKCKPTLQGRECRDVGWALEPGDVGMAANRARRRAGRIKEDHIERPRLPLRGVSGDRFCAEMKPGEVL